MKAARKIRHILTASVVILCMAASISFGGPCSCQCITPPGLFATGCLPTIPYLMEKLDISRMDRIPDIKDNIMKAYDLMVRMPKEFASADLSKMLGGTGLNAILDLMKEYQSAKSQLESLYSNPQSLLDKLLGKAAITGSIDSLFSKGGNIFGDLELDSMGTGKWSKYMETSNIEVTNTQGKAMGTGQAEPQVYKGIKEMVDKEDLTPGMKALDPSLMPGAGVAAFMGSLEMPNLSNKQYMYKAAQQYGQDVKESRIEAITGMMTEAALITKKIKDTLRESQNEDMERLSDSQLDFAGSGGAWKGSAASYSTVVSMNLKRQLLYKQIYDLMRIKVRMRAQAASLLLYDYVQYCYDAANMHVNIARKGL